MKELTRNESSVIINMIKDPGSIDLAIDILINSDRRIHRSLAAKLAHCCEVNSYFSRFKINNSWARIRAKHWTNRWIPENTIETEKHTYRMKTLNAKKGSKPPKRHKTVLVKVGEEYCRGTYCEENRSWLVAGRFVRPKDVIWFKEKTHDKRIPNI